MTDAPEVLELIVGAVSPIVVEVVKADGLPEDFSGVTAASLRIEDEAGVVVLDRKTSAGNLSIDAAAATLTGTLSQPEADAFSPGTYLGEFALQKAGVWLHSEPFYVRIKRGRAPHS